MRFGVVYPQTEFGHDPAAIRAFAQTAEELGYTHILAYDHILGASPERPGGWEGPYTIDDPFMEPFVLFSYMAAVTKTIEFTSGILILPQRQTALVAKQAATLDVLSQGRLRLGVGIGWNPVEYQALGQNFHTRGQRIEEQVAVLRQLWAQPEISFEGKWHRIDAAGLNPLPLQRFIPIWFGGHAERVLERAARLGDGWMPNYRRARDAQPSIDILAKHLAAHGKKLQDFGIEARLHYAGGNADKWKAYTSAWDEVGATHISINLMRSGLETPQEFLQAMRLFAQEMGISSPPG